MKNKVRTLTVVLLCALCFFSAARATDALEPSPRYARMTGLRADMDIQQGIVRCNGSAKTTVTGDQITVITELFSNEKGSWDIACTWIGRSNGGTVASAGGDRKIKPGCSYQVVVTATAYDSTGRQVDKNTAQTEIKKG